MEEAHKKTGRTFMQRVSLVGMQDPANDRHHHQLLNSLVLPEAGELNHSSLPVSPEVSYSEIPVPAFRVGTRSGQEGQLPWALWYHLRWGGAA